MFQGFGQGLRACARPAGGRQRRGPKASSCQRFLSAQPPIYQPAQAIFLSFTHPHPPPPRLLHLGDASEAWGGPEAASRRFFLDFRVSECILNTSWQLARSGTKSSAASKAFYSRFEIYAVPDEDFRRVFGSKDEVYLEDLEESLQDDAIFWHRFYAKEVDRRTVIGIHGVFHMHPKAKVSIHA